MGQGPLNNVVLDEMTAEQIVCYRWTLAILDSFHNRLCSYFRDDFADF